MRVSTLCILMTLAHPPVWLNALADIYLLISFISAAIVLFDVIFRQRQKMAVMNVVWPITALYWGPVTLWGYYKLKPKQDKKGNGRSGGKEQPDNGAGENPSRPQVLLAVSHCGAGCTLGDILSELMVFAAGIEIARSAFAARLTLDFALAFSIGIVFQYFSIVPMRHLSFGQGLRAALKADTLSLTCFEIGLFGWMALTQYVFFPQSHLEASQAMFWFMMQVGMIIGFFTSYPANVWLLKKGWKGKMG